MESKIFCAIFLFIISLVHCEHAQADNSPIRIGSDEWNTASHESAKSSMNDKTTLDIFLLEIIPFKAKFVLKNVRSVCFKALVPHIEKCYRDYEFETRYSLEIRGNVNEVKVGCCNLWKYHSCVVGAIERLAHYSIRSCSEYDAIAAEEVLLASEKQTQARLMCMDYHRQSFYCSPFFESSVALNIVLALGVVAIFVAAFMAGYMMYLSNLRVNVLYLKAALSNGYRNDGVELLERKGGQFR